MKQTLQIVLAALLFGATGTASASTPCGTNLEYELDGTVLCLISPDPTQPAAIQTEAFKDNTTITSIVIPDNVWQIGSQAFMGCTALTDVELSNVQDISTKAFQGCTSLASVVIPPAVTNIGEHAFYGCSLLQSVLCRPQTVPTLGTDGFADCHSSLKICVSALGTYRAATNWDDYYDELTLCYLDENDEQSVVESKITMFRDYYLKTEIDIFRTIRKAGCFNTLTLPFNVPDIESSPLAGAEVYTFTSATVENGTLQLDIAPLSGTVLAAGTPYLIQWSNTGEVLTRMHFTGITWDDDQATDDAGTGDIAFHGLYGKTHISDNTENGVNEDGDNHFHLFLGGNNRLYWPTDGNDASAKMLGFRAWFDITSGEGADAPVRRGMPAALRIVSTPTNIHAVQDNKTPYTKQMRDGQLIILRNGKEYSVTGQLINGK